MQSFGTEINCFLSHSKQSVSGIRNVYQVNFHLLPWFYYSISNSPHQVVLVLLPQHELRYKVHPLDGLASHPQLKRNTRLSRSIQTILTVSLLYYLKQWCTKWGFGVFKPTPQKFQRPSKIVPNSTRLWKLLKIAEFRMPTLQDVWEKSQ